MDDNIPKEFFPNFCDIIDLLRSFNTRYANGNLFIAVMYSFVQMISGTQSIRSLMIDGLNPYV